MSRKKAETNMWWIIITAIIVIVIGAITLFVTRDGINTGSENIKLLSSCANQGGDCTTKEACGPGNQALYRFGGCPLSDSAAEKDKEYCCIPPDPNE